MSAWCERWNVEINEDKTRVICFSHQGRPPDSLLTLNVRSVPFVNGVGYLGVIFDKGMAWGLHMEMIEARALIGSVMTYACPAWGFVAEACLLKLQRLRSGVLCTIGTLPRCTLVRDVHVAFQVPYIYGCIAGLCRGQADVIHDNENENVRSVGQRETPHRKHRGLELGSLRLRQSSPVIETSLI
jgi:hypothetical protein